MHGPESVVENEQMWGKHNHAWARYLSLVMLIGLKKEITGKCSRSLLKKSNPDQFFFLVPFFHFSFTPSFFFF
jgi:hypothetical protein